MEDKTYMAALDVFDRKELERIQLSKRRNETFRMELAQAMKGSKVFTKEYLSKRYAGNRKALETISKYLR